jgi:hypothetical protein
MTKSVVNVTLLKQMEINQLNKRKKNLLKCVAPKTVPVRVASWFICALRPALRI